MRALEYYTLIYFQTTEIILKYKTNTAKKPITDFLNIYFILNEATTNFKKEGNLFKINDLNFQLNIKKRINKKITHICIYK
jgi:hypothetical protein